MKHWYKILSVILISYTLVWGMLGPVPRLDILNETIRNVYYHVPIWFAMLFMMSVSLFYSLRTLASGPDNNNSLRFRLLHLFSFSIPLTKVGDDKRASNAAAVGLFFCLPGLLTGSLWARFTWNTWWTFQDPKLSGVAIGVLIYLAYFILRSSMDDEMKKARISAVYNVFAFVMMNVFIMVLPRMTDSLHPGNGGNPAFAKYDLDSGMRLVFYPAVIGWVLFSFWIFKMSNRMDALALKLNEE